MYYPSSQIQTDLYSNGTLLIKSTQQPYVGFYWSTSTGKYFIGKSPDAPQGNSVELINSQNSNSPRDLNFHEPLIDQNNKVQISYSSFDVVNYLKLNSDINVEKLPQIPTHIPSSPVQEDYENGKFTRFLCKQKNASLFIEIDQTTFTKLSESNPEFDYERFSVFKLPWILAGPQDSVALQNKRTVDYIENRTPVPGLSQYLKYNYLLHYNTTPGVIKKTSKKVYADTGQEIPTNLPESYRLMKNKKACVGCLYFQQGICNKWSAPIRQEYYCKSFKPNKSITPQQFLESFSSKANIYNK